MHEPVVSKRASNPPDAVLQADAADPLARFRSRFRWTDDVIYLSSDSFGAPAVATAQRLAERSEQDWARDLIFSWRRHDRIGAPWRTGETVARRLRNKIARLAGVRQVYDGVGAPQRIGDKIARSIGAREGEVTVADSTPVNMLKLLGAALDLQAGRRVILSGPGDFLTDFQIAEGVTHLVAGKRRVTCPAEEIAAAIDNDTAVVMLSHVHAASGRKLDMGAITAAAHAKGALVLFDLSHSVGAMPVDLNGCRADLAVGCGDKYLNGGPGAPAFLFVAGRLQAELRSSRPGAMDPARPFDVLDAYAPGARIDRFACGSPPALSLISLEAGVDLMLEADPALISAKSQALSELFIATLQAQGETLGLTLVSPRAAADRGSHVCFAHDQAYAVYRALTDRGVRCDFHAPNLIGFGFSPLYTRFAEVWMGAHLLCSVDLALRGPA